MANCAYCNKEFKQRNRSSKETPNRYCSRACYFADRNSKVQSPKKVVTRCAKCGKPVTRWASQINDGPNYCSRSCSNSANWERAKQTKKAKHVPKLERQCKHCGKTFHIYPYRSREAAFCSRDCFYEYRVKQTNGNYKGQRADISPSYFRKHKRQCAICGFDIVVALHHITPKAEGGPDTFDNLIPLCPNHHAMADRELISRDELFSIRQKIKLNTSNPQDHDATAPQSENQHQFHQQQLFEHSSDEETP